MNSATGAVRGRDYLAHMLEAVRLARQYTKDLSKTAFQADIRTQQAVILNLITIGEAASHIARTSSKFPESYPGLPWKEMRGMRNRMAHGYFAIDLDVVWETVQNSLPELEQKIIEVLREVDADNGHAKPKDAT